ncbi:MAG: nitroreductase family protein [Eubacteriales bacterium]
MDFVKLAAERRSIRSFTDKEVTKEQLDTLLEAAMLAPSGGNRQPWHFYVITNRDVKAQIIERSCHQSWIMSSQALIVVCAIPELSGVKYGDRGRGLYCIQDTAAAVQNVLLCAADMGLGACWCGAFDEAELSDILGLPESSRPVALIPVGYPAATASMPRRRDSGETVSYID